MFTGITLFQVLNDMFPEHAFLMNGLIQGVKVNMSNLLKHISITVMSLVIPQRRPLFRTHQ